MAVSREGELARRECQIGIFKMTNNHNWYFSRKVFVMVFLGVIVLEGNRRVDGREVPRVDLNKILDDWKNRQASLGSVRYELTGRGLVAKGTYTGYPGLPADLQGQTVPPDDYVYEKKLTWLIDFDHNRVRKVFKEEQFNSDLGKFIPSGQINIYDGLTTKNYIPKEQNQVEGLPRGPRVPELGLVKNGNTIYYAPGDYPIFLAQGIVGLTETLTKTPGPQKVRLPLEKLQIEIRGQRLFEGRECVVLRISPKATYVDELWVDPSHRSAILRMDVYANQTLFTRIDISYREDGNLPVAWKTNQYSGKNGMIETSESFQVERIELNPKLNTGDFDIPLRPGMVITTADVKAGLERDWGTHDYRVAQDGKSLEELDAVGGQRWRLGLFALGSVVIAVALLYWLLRRKSIGFSGRPRAGG